jgi:hypothetical protein
MKQENVVVSVEEYPLDENTCSTILANVHHKYVDAIIVLDGKVHKGL